MQKGLGRDFLALGVRSLKLVGIFHIVVSVCALLLLYAEGLSNVRNHRRTVRGDKYFQTRHHARVLTTG